MIAAHEGIFSTGILHEQFCATTDLLGKLVAAAPRAMTLAQLHSATGRDARTLTRLCADLLRDGLITATAEGAYRLARDPAEVTLEDVYRCVVSTPAQRARTAPKATEHHASHAVDLLLMQAALAIGQSVQKHLRQFSLDRLKPAGSGRFPVVRPVLRALDYENSNDFDFSMRTFATPAAHSA
jgi:DNA-binding IscR family transcriptional regulator